MKRERQKNKWEEKKKAKKQKTTDSALNPAQDEPVDPQKTEERRERKRLTLEHRKQQESENPEVLIDCDFHDIMKDTEQASIAVQLAHCYSTIRKMETRPMRLGLCGVHPDLLERLKKNSGFDQWGLTIHENKIEQDSRPRDNFIYLTADAEEELAFEKLTSNHVLVIGGFVDRNRHKGLTFKKATELGIKTAKLPLKNFVHLIASQVLTVNHVVDILATAYQTGGDWETAVKKVIPERKVAL